MVHGLDDPSGNIALKLVGKMSFLLQKLNMFAWRI